VPYIEKNLIKNLRSIGVDAQYDEIPFQEMLAHYYRQTERTYHIMLLATNFQYVFDPYYTFHSDDVYQGVHNTTGIRDEELERLAYVMRRIVPGENETYLQKWMDFQRHWAEELPMAPLCSNVYFDFFRPDLQNYIITSSNTWAAALLYSYLGESRDAEPANLAEDEPGEGAVILE
jgi:hypothetical protein